MILIVDDTPENLFSLKSVLEYNQFKVDTASSGEEALRKILKTSYTLILLDVQMPGMDGFEVAEILSGYSKAKDSAIIFLSANYTTPENILQGYGVGAVDYITKPIDPTLLLTRVKALYEIVQNRIEIKRQQEEVKRLFDHQKKLVLSLSRERKKLLITQKLAKIASWEYYFENEELVCAPEVYKLLGLNGKQELTLNDFLSSLSQEDHEKYLYVVKRFSEHRATFSFSHYYDTPIGRKYLHQAGKVEIRNNKPYKIIGAVQDKTEEKNNELEFLKLYERYKLVNKATNDIISDWDVMSNTLDFNSNLGKVLGYSKESIGHPEDWWESVVHPDDWHHMKRTFESAIFKRENNWSAECRVRCSDGSFKELFAQSFCLYDQSGRLLRMVTASKDLSGFRNIENKLHNTELKLLQTVESINEAFFTCNIAWEITYWNKKCEDFLGLKKQETLGKVLWDLFPGSRETRFYSEYSACLRTGRSCSFEEYYVPLEKWFRVNVHPSEEGLAIYLDDMTEELMRELELSRALEKAELIKATSHDVIWEADLTTNHVHFNKNFFTEYGYPADISTTLDWFEARIHPEDRERVVTTVHECMENNKNFWEQEYRLLDAQSNYHHVHGRIHIVRDLNNRPTHLTGSIINLQKLKEKESRLAKIAFSNSHLLRKPLANILGLLDLLNTEQLETQQEIISLIKESGLELDDIIKQIANTASQDSATSSSL
ncbi:PAS domain-containing protein [Pedobacter sp. SYSU D00535]|uniref:PAS domain-containing protein n=1 Tax=Pedobacter sp. SYSU D00535 TaxID=2810308 RepID=UPI001A961849|nr:PAS domain-containing protein [Pedobacter sp. SYSU D00535]